MRCRGRSSGSAKLKLRGERNGTNFIFDADHHGRCGSGFAVPAYGQYANIYVQQDSSVYNVSAGFDAKAGDGGVQNTAYGFDALENNGCCGYYNSAFGYQALEDNNLGAYNTAVGFSALWSLQ